MTFILKSVNSPYHRHIILEMWLLLLYASSLRLELCVAGEFVTLASYVWLWKFNRCMPEHQVTPTTVASLSPIALYLCKSVMDVRSGSQGVKTYKEILGMLELLSNVDPGGDRKTVLAKKEMTFSVKPLEHQIQWSSEASQHHCRTQSSLQVYEKIRPKLLWFQSWSFKNTQKKETFLVCFFHVARSLDLWKHRLSIDWAQRRL